MKIIHTIGNPLSAHKFIEPLVQSLLDNGYKAEIWCNKVPELANFDKKIATPLKFINVNITFNIFKLAINFYKIILYLLRTKPQVLESHITLHATIPLLAGFICRVPHRIYHNHGISYNGEKGLVRLILFAIEKLNCYLAHQIITVNQDLAQQLQNICRNKTVSILGPGSACGIAEDMFLPECTTYVNKTKIQLNIKQKEFVFLYIGRPVKRKGFLDIISSFNALNQQSNYSSKLIMCGIKQKDLQKYNIKLCHNIITLGFVNDIAVYLDIANVLVLPSQSEGLPYSVIEAGAKNTPAILTNYPGVKQVVIDNKTGFIIPKNNIQALTNKMLYCLKNKNKVKDIGNNAFMDMQKFMRKNIISAYIKLIGTIKL